MIYNTSGGVPKDAKLNSGKNWSQKKVFSGPASKNLKANPKRVKLLSSNFNTFQNKIQDIDRI